MDDDSGGMVLMVPAIKSTAARCTDRSLFAVGSTVDALRIADSIVVTLLSHIRPPF